MAWIGVIEHALKREPRYSRLLSLKRTPIRCSAISIPQRKSRIRIELLFEYILIGKLECQDLQLDLKTAEHFHKNERASLKWCISSLLSSGPNLNKFNHSLAPVENFTLFAERGFKQGLLSKIGECGDPGAWFSKKTKQRWRNLEVNSLHLISR